jgi:hypothetical protein
MPGGLREAAHTELRQFFNNRRDLRIFGQIRSSIVPFKGRRFVLFCLSPSNEPTALGRHTAADMNEDGQHIRAEQGQNDNPLGRHQHRTYVVTTTPAPDPSRVQSALPNERLPSPTIRMLSPGAYLQIQYSVLPSTPRCQHSRRKRNQIRTNTLCQSLTLPQQQGHHPRRWDQQLLL